MVAAFEQQKLEKKEDFCTGKTVFQKAYFSWDLIFERVVLEISLKHARY